MKERRCRSSMSRLILCGFGCAFLYDFGCVFCMTLVVHYVWLWLCILYDFGYAFCVTSVVHFVWLRLCILCDLGCAFCVTWLCILCDFGCAICVISTAWFSSSVESTSITQYLFWLRSRCRRITSVWLRLSDWDGVIGLCPRVNTHKDLETTYNF